MIKGIDLSLLFGPGVPVPAPREVVEAIQTVRIEENSGETPSGFELTFSLDKNSPLNTIFLLSGGGAIPILRVALVATLSGRQINLINGVVTMTDIRPGGGGEQSILRVIGKDLSATMSLLDFSGLPYPAMPPFARVNLILAKYAWLGVIPQVIPSLEGPPLPTDKIPRHQDKDYDYVMRLAHEAGYTFFFKPGPAPASSIAYWGPEIRIGQVQPALTVDSGPATNVEELRFSYAKEDFSIPVVFIHNQETKAPIPIPIPPVTPFHPPLGAIPPLPPRIDRLTDTARLKPAEAIQRGFAHAARNADPVTGQGRIDVLRYGRIIRARSLIGVRGAGQAFDGVHYVKSVTHDISRGSYKQSVELKRNGLLPTQSAVPAE
ncbi:hypothetical protein KUV62_16725 [Salipiger bermudensis]|uniref:hypothetical protein n=1 Tax=Salipiger bermudensis TaxID=344736 RepID=UPI001C9A1CAB|nr:hypothetical protein [Salipiger bermudensis]MBY6005570.1 hypothetical protein [Salipiger bermudensis]